MAGERWHDEGWLFATPTGRGSSTRDARVRDGRLHDARHTAATVLLIDTVRSGMAGALVPAG
ncbi:hypothetical protein [Streptomyces boncukensis]|uniref:hypothetical protein n=1 Tax=Streptomyces boncukensis TaxID=2711219 RepID=UPI003B975C4F